MQKCSFKASTVASSVSLYMLLLMFGFAYDLIDMILSQPLLEATRSPDDLFYDVIFFSNRHVHEGHDVHGLVVTMWSKDPAVRGVVRLVVVARRVIRAGERCISTPTSAQGMLVQPSMFN